MDTHNCTDRTRTVSLIPPDRWFNKWRMVVDTETIQVVFCPFCGERLPTKDTPYAKRGEALEHVE